MNCPRCAKQLNQLKCEKCGFDLKNSALFSVFDLSESYLIGITEYILEVEKKQKIEETIRERELKEQIRKEKEIKVEEEKIGAANIVKDLINRIDDASNYEDFKIRIAEARSAYDKLLDNQKSFVANYDFLEYAETNNKSRQAYLEMRREKLLARKKELKEKLRAAGIDPDEIERKAREDFFKNRNEVEVHKKKTELNVQIGNIDKEESEICVNSTFDDEKSVGSGKVGKAYKCWSDKDSSPYITSDFWAANQIGNGKNYEVIYVWKIDEKIDHILDSEELEKYIGIHGLCKRIKRGPAKAYKYLNKNSGCHHITRNVWMANQIDKNFKVLWVWMENYEIHHIMDEKEKKKYLPPDEYN